MGTEQVNGKREGVTLLRPGIGTETIVLPEGSTLADLLRQAGVNPRSSSIFIDGRELAEHLVLKNGMVITVVPQAKNAASQESWRDLMGDFHDDPAFEEMMQAVQAARDAEKEQR
jgi:sulfur carrier protein ThiS